MGPNHKTAIREAFIQDDMEKLLFFFTGALFSSLAGRHSPNFPKLPKTKLVGMELARVTLSPASQYVKTHVDSIWSCHIPVPLSACSNRFAPTATPESNLLRAHQCGTN
jgi:hypothetical protein